MINYKNFKETDIAIYLNFPFCHHPCSYCHYVENLKFGYKNIPYDYFLLVTKQLNEVCSKIKGKKVDSIYFGGGTPSLLNDAQLKTIEQIFKKNQITAGEISIEIHPAYCNFNYENNNFFTRYSLGVQSFSDETREFYRRLDYENNEIFKIVESCKKTKKINIDLIFSEKINLEEINLIEKLQPTSFTCYPNTKCRGEKRLLNVISTLQKVKSALSSYENVGKSTFIFVKKGEKTSNYAILEYEKLGNIFGIGNNSVSYVGDKSYLTIYEGNSFIVKERHRQPSRYINSIFGGLQSGIKKSKINEFLPDLLNCNCLYSVSNGFNISEKHQTLKDEELVYIPVAEYEYFIEYVSKKYSDYLDTFLCTIGFGDSNLDILKSVYNSELLLEGFELQDLSKLIKKNKALKKIETPDVYILVEGIDGSGKDTFVQYLCIELKKRFVYEDNESMISVTGQPNTSFSYGEYAKKFVEDISYDGTVSDVVNALSANRIESESYLMALKGIKILIRGIATDKATLEKVFGENEYNLGFGEKIKKWDYYLVIDVDEKIADERIEKRGIPRTWREKKEYLCFFRNFYQKFSSDNFMEKRIIENNSLFELKKAARLLADEIYANEFNRQ